MEQIPNAEKILSKVETDKLIEDLSKKQDDLTSKRDLLSTHLAQLVHEYGQGKESLDVFKEAKELLEKRIENPTLSNKLMDKFAVLFGKEAVGTDPVESKGEFLDRRFLTSEARGYRKTGGELRETVKSIAEEKDVIRELIGEDLSFRGGTVEGEEKTPREESIKKIEDVIKSIDGELSENSKLIAEKREEALESWKRENPEEWAKIEEMEKRKSKFAEFLQTNPSSSEIASIGINNRDNELFEEARIILKNRGENIASLGLYIPEDFEYMSNLIDREFKNEDSAKKLIRGALYSLPHELQLDIVRRVEGRSDCGLYCEAKYKGQTSPESTCISADFYSGLSSDLRSLLKHKGPKELYEDLYFPEDPKMGIEFAFNFRSGVNNSIFVKPRNRIRKSVLESLENFIKNPNFETEVERTHLIVALAYESPLSKEYAEQVSNKIIGQLPKKIKEYYSVEEFKRDFDIEMWGENAYDEWYVRPTYYDSEKALHSSNKYLTAISNIKEQIEKKENLLRDLS